MIKINLLPPEYRPQPQIRPLRLLLLLGLVLLPLLAAGVAAYCWYELHALDREIADLAAERAQYGPLYDRVLAMERQLGQLQEQLASREKLTADHLNAVQILTTLSRMVPENVVIGSVSVAAGGGLSISGTAADYYGVGAFQLRLTKSEEFAPAILSGASGGKGSVSFQLTTAFRKGAGGGGAVPASIASSSTVQAQAQGGAPSPRVEAEGPAQTPAPFAPEGEGAAGSAEGVAQ